MAFMSYLPICVFPAWGWKYSSNWTVDVCGLAILYIPIRSGHVVGEGLQRLEEISWEKNNLWCKGRAEDVHFSFTMLEGVFGKGGDGE